MQVMKIAAATLIAISALSSSANASVITREEYVAAGNIVTFNSIQDGELISTQYANVKFGGQIVGQTNGDGVFSSTSANSYYAPNRTDRWSATFSNLVTSVGFYAEYWQADVITLNAYKNGIFTESYNFVKPNNNIFSTNLVGITNLNGFDKIDFSITKNMNGFFNMDDFKFQTKQAQGEVPEPGSLAMLGLGLAALAYRRRKTA